MIEVLTTFHKPGWEQYGKRMVETFLQYWPADIKIHLYCENVQNLLTIKTSLNTKFLLLYYQNLLNDVHLNVDRIQKFVIKNTLTRDFEAISMANRT